MFFVFVGYNPCSLSVMPSWHDSSPEGRAVGFEGFFADSSPEGRAVGLRGFHTLLFFVFVGSPRKRVDTWVNPYEIFNRLFYDVVVESAAVYVLAIRSYIPAIVASKLVAIVSPLIVTFEPPT